MKIRNYYTYFKSIFICEMLQLNIIPLFWRLHTMNKNKLQREGQKWVHDGIITEQQLNAILDNYVKRNPSYIFITFAVLFISIGVLLFIFSDWTLISNRIRVAIITVFMFSLYKIGRASCRERVYLTVVADV